MIIETKDRPNINTKELIEKVESKLLEYMEIEGIVIENNKFLCPAHSDTVPSAGIIPDSNNTKWHCFTCGAGLNLFDMVHFREGLPIKGGGFFTAIRYIMDKFDDLKILKNEDVKATDVVTHNIRRINQYICSLFQDDTFCPEKFDEAVKRGWSKATCKRYCIGSLPYIKVKEAVLSKLDLDISAPEYKETYMQILFSSRGLTFTLFDHTNSPVGFSTRNLDWRKGEKGKYVNSREIPEIFKKEKHLFQIAHAVKTAKDIGYLYVFEGNADVITAFDKGIYNCTAICGTAFTESQVRLLVSLHMYNIVLCLDSDPAGVLAMRELLNKKTYLSAGLHVEIVDVPIDLAKENCDPDYYIRTYGAEAFRKLPRIAAFDWLLSKIPSGTNQNVIMEQMLPHISMTPMKSAWQAKIEALAEYTGIAQDLIKQDVIDLCNDTKHKLKLEKQKIVQNVYNEALSGGDATVNVLQKAIDKIRKLEESKFGNDISIEDNVTEIQSVYQKWQTYDPSKGVTGWKTGYTQLDQKLDGIPFHSGYIAFPGLPHVGKSAYLLNIVTNMLMLTDQDENQNLNCYFMTIDDSTEAVISRMVGILTGYAMRELKRYQSGTQIFKNDIDKAIKRINNWQKKGHLYMADAKKGTNLETGINNMLKLRTKFPDKNNLMVIDNFHKLSAPEGFKERMAWIQLSKMIHERTVADKFTALSTFELNKSAHFRDSQSAADISETGCIEYDANGIIMCDNQYHKTGGNTKYQWRHDNFNYPIFEIDVTKNKINEYKGKIYYKFNTSTTKMEEITDVQKLIGETKAGINSSNSLEI